MADKNGIGAVDHVLVQGRIAYGVDSVGNAYPIETIANSAGTLGALKIAQREPFIFRPGSTALASGMVLSGSRSSAATITSGTAANSTYWGSWLNYQPLRNGLIDGINSGGILEGQLTIGALTASGTGTCKLTARIANTANTSAPTTMLALSGTITIAGTTEVFTTFVLPYLQCDTIMNSVPFSVAIGVQTQQAGTAVIARVMESSYIQGEFEATG